MSSNHNTAINSIPPFAKTINKKDGCSSKDLQDNIMANSRAYQRSMWTELGFGQLSTYERKYVLGTGTYSTVYKGISKITNKIVALKEIRIVADEGVPFTAIREISLLRKLKHNNIITLHDIITTKKIVLLVFEYAERDLSAYIAACNFRVPRQNVCLLLFQLLRALKYCHSSKILHRDIKPQNILINNCGELKLADFGLARSQSVPTKSYSDEVVTLWYRPPDVLLGNTSYGSSIDIWGVGCIFFELTSGQTLFVGDDQTSLLESIFEILGAPSNANSWPNIHTDEEYRSLCFKSAILNQRPRNLAILAPRLSESAIDLLNRFLKFDSRQRISAAEAMKHAYFSHLPPDIHQLDNHQSIYTIKALNFIHSDLKLKSSNKSKTNLNKYTNNHEKPNRQHLNRTSNKPHLNKYNLDPTAVQYMQNLN